MEMPADSKEQLLQPLKGKVAIITVSTVIVAPEMQGIDSFDTTGRLSRHWQRNSMAVGTTRR